MQKIDIAELRRLLADGEAAPIRWAQNAAAVWNALPALLDELEAARLEMRRQASVISELRQDLRQLFEQQHHTKLIGAAEELEELRNHCLECSGSGIEQSGVCHCGESMATHSKWDNHAALEMTRSCIFCKHLTERAAQLRREAEGK